MGSTVDRQWHCSSTGKQHKLITLKDWIHPDRKEGNRGQAGERKSGTSCAQTLQSSCSGGFPTWQQTANRDQQFRNGQLLWPLTQDGHFNKGKLRYGAIMNLRNTNNYRYRDCDGCSDTPGLRIHYILTACFHVYHFYCWQKHILNKPQGRGVDQTWASVLVKM